MLPRKEIFNDGEEDVGTNYYWIKPGKKCLSCGTLLGEERLHIGKSSAGWVFALHVYPTKNILDLPDWWRLWQQDVTEIRDEYGKLVSRADMLSCVLARMGSDGSGNRENDDRWYHLNRVERGPFGLARARIDGIHCVGHGSGTYSLNVGSEESW